VAQPETAQLIPRATLFGKAVRHGGQLSPRGDRVAFLAPRDGVQNLWVLSVDAMDEARPVTDERVRGIRFFRWAADSNTLLYLQDENGDENWRLYAVDAGAGGAPRALTPAGARAEILGISAAETGAVIVTLNERDRAWPDVVRIDLATGQRTILQRNGGPRGYSSFLLDRSNAVRLGVRNRADGGFDIVGFDEGGGANVVTSVPFEDAFSTRLIGFESDGRHFLMLDTRAEEGAERDRAARTSSIACCPRGPERRCTSRYPSLIAITSLTTLEPSSGSRLRGVPAPGMEVGARRASRGTVPGDPAAPAPGMRPVARLGGGRRPIEPAAACPAAASGKVGRRSDDPAGCRRPKKPPGSTKPPVGRGGFAEVRVRGGPRACRARSLRAF
jgi:Tol biopolymer transport system component